ncbi:MAG: hypothetical protein LBG58_01915 [Planctomycetaceae bacterium]|nr:hypothetical protein [Planctomycetaceae bacterium]
MPNADRLRRERFPFVGDGQGCSFALKGQYIPARHIAAGNGQHDQRPERAVDSWRVEHGELRVSQAE